MSQFNTLCRCALLFPQTSLALLHNREQPCLVSRSHFFKYEAQSKDSPITGLLHSAIPHCNEPGQRPLFHCHPIKDTRVVILQHRMGTLRAPTHCHSSQGIQPELASADIRREEHPADLPVPYQDLWSAMSIRRKND